jgi:putative membrane protein
MIRIRPRIVFIELGLELRCNVNADARIRNPASSTSCHGGCAAAEREARPQCPRGPREPPAAPDYSLSMKTKHSAKRVRAQLFLTALLGASFPILASGQTATVRDPAPPAAPARDVHRGAVELKRHDRDFFTKVAKASMSEVEISRVALARTTNPEVRRFAQMMIDDHESASEELAMLASSKGVTLPAKEVHPSRWEKHDAKSFDKDYINKMVSDHEDVVKLFEKEAKDGDDADAVAFARKHLPRVQHHLQQAHDLKRMFK